MPCLSRRVVDGFAHQLVVEGLSRGADVAERCF
jgi:hypothetical protein